MALSGGGVSNGLRCAFREVHGRCEPELVARDEADKLRSVLFDVVVAEPCAVELSAFARCGAPAAGVIKLNEVGWVRACPDHLDDNDEDGSIRLIPARVGTH